MDKSELDNFKETCKGLFSIISVFWINRPARIDNLIVLGDSDSSAEVVNAKIGSYSDTFFSLNKKRTIKCVLLCSLKNSFRYLLCVL